MNNFGLNDDYEYMEIEFDSLDNSGSISAGVAATDWPNFYIGGKVILGKVSALKVLTCTVPFSYYVITPENGTFYVAYDTDGFVPVTITPGNYNMTTICTELAAQLLAATGAVFTVSYVTATQKLLFSVPATHYFAFQFGAADDTGNYNPRLWIGFPAGVTFSNSNIMMSPNAIQLSGPNYLYLNSSTLGDKTDIFLPEGARNLSGGNTGPQIANITVNADSSGMIYYQDPDPQKWFSCGDTSIQQIDFFFTMGNTSSQKPLRFNGLGFNIKLGLLLKKGSRTISQSGYFGQQRVTNIDRPV